MNDKNQIDGKVWGVHINHTMDAGYPPLPEWVKAGNRMAWTNRGVIVWDGSANTIKCLLPQQALDVLDDLREWAKLKEEPFCLGWDSYTLPFSEENRIAWRKTKNRRNDSPGKNSASWSLVLSPQQARELLQYLENHQNEIRELGDEHAREARKALGRVYSFLIRLGRERKKKEQESP